MRIPFVPEIPDVVEVLKLLSNSTVYTQRLTDLKNLQDDLNRQIDTYEKYQDLDNALAQAKDNMVNSEGVRRNADEYFATRKAQTTDLYEKKMAEIQRARDESSNVAKDLEIRAAELEQVARILGTREKLLQDGQAGVAILRAETDAAKIAADRSRAVYEEKLRQIKAVAGE